jgi:hypothetical protein
MIPVHHGVMIPFVQTVIEGSGDDRRSVPEDIMIDGVRDGWEANVRWTAASTGAATSRAGSA